MMYPKQKQIEKKNCMIEKPTLPRLHSDTTDQNRHERGKGVVLITSQY